MTFKNRLITAAASLALMAGAVPTNAVCAENHTVTVIDFNGKVMATLSVPHGKSVDLSGIDTTSLNYHLNDYTQVGFNGWSKYPEKITEDTAIYALFLRMTIECPSIPVKTEYYSRTGNIKTDGLNVTIRKYTQLPEKDENGAFITETEIVNITDTCSIVPSTIEEALNNTDNGLVKIIPPGGNRAIATYDISYFEGLGDVVEDESVDASDASKVLSVYAQISTGSEIDLNASKIPNCDVNRDETIDSADASMILAFYAAASTSDKEITWDDFL